VEWTENCYFSKTGYCWTGECVQMHGRSWLFWKGVHHLSSHSEWWANVWACEEGIYWFAGSEEFQGSSTYDGCWRFLLLLRGGSLSFLLHRDKEWNSGVYSHWPLSIFHDWWRRSTNRCCCSCYYCREVPHWTWLIRCWIIDKALLLLSHHISSFSCFLQE